MRANKPAIIWSTVLSIVALAASILTHLVEYIKNDYISNLFAGLFASGILALLISIINHRYEYRKTLTQFYICARTAVDYFENVGKLIINHDHKSSIDLDFLKYQPDLERLSDAFDEMSFFFKEMKKRKYIHEEIYDQIYGCAELISMILSLSDEYNKAQNEDKIKMQDLLKDLADELLTRNEKMKHELTGKYYHQFLYPGLKKKTEKAD